MEREAGGLVQWGPGRFLPKRFRDPPFNVRRRFFGTTTKKNVVFDLEPAEVLVEQCKFFINVHCDKLPSRAWVTEGIRYAGIYHSRAAIKTESRMANGLPKL